MRPALIAAAVLTVLPAAHAENCFEECHEAVSFENGKIETECMLICIPDNGVPPVTPNPDVECGNNPISPICMIPEPDAPSY